MNPIATATTSILLSTVGDLLSGTTTGSVLSGAGKFSGNINQTGKAITSLTRQTNILARAFIDEGIVDEPALPGLMKCIHGWYCAQILAAIHIGQMATADKSVASVMTPLNTGANGNMSGTSMLGHLSKKVQTPLASSMATASFATESNNNNNNKSESPSIKSVKVGDARIGPIGELYEVKINNPANPDATVTVPIFVQIQPEIISEEYAPRLIDMNVPVGLWKRWTQLSTGEISFWKDFILNLDRIKHHNAAIKNPEAAKAFNNFIKTVNDKNTYSLMEAAKGGEVSSNLANTVVIFSENSVVDAKIKSGIDLHNSSNRETFFRETYCMCTCIIDAMHQRVTVYFNGIDGEANFPYSHFKNDKNGSGVDDFIQAIQGFTTNNVGRIR